MPWSWLIAGDGWPELPIQESWWTACLLLCKFWEKIEVNTAQQPYSMVKGGVDEVGAQNL